MAINSSSEVVGIIASLALLTPLVRAIHRWHIDARKTSKAAKTATLQSQSPIANQGQSRWSRMSGFERWAAISNLVTFIVCGLTLVALVLFSPSHPASLREVSLIGLLVSMVVVTSRWPDA
ncbi:MAG TPA: hypothetical protein VGF13_11945 [Verrucomicrobiae bacterium]|jgi:hypothetical protein